MPKLRAESFTFPTVVLGSGERLFQGVHLLALGYACSLHVNTVLATHVVLTKI
jgi:hypothetical protein